MSLDMLFFVFMNLIPYPRNPNLIPETLPQTINFYSYFLIFVHYR